MFPDIRLPDSEIHFEKKVQLDCDYIEYLENIFIDVDDVVGAAKRIIVLYHIIHFSIL